MLVAEQTLDQKLHKAAIAAGLVRAKQTILQTQVQDRPRSVAQLPVLNYVLRSSVSSATTWSRRASTCAGIGSTSGP